MRPTRRLIAVMAACVAIAAFGLLLQKVGQGPAGRLLMHAGAGGAVLVALAALFDAFSRRHPPEPQFERTSLPRGGRIPSKSPSVRQTRACGASRSS